jgi:hypothetical protein
MAAEAAAQAELDPDVLPKGLKRDMALMRVSKHQGGLSSSRNDGCKAQTQPWAVA